MQSNESAFSRWIAELRFEAGKVYSRFEVAPDHWRDQFDKGLTAAQAFDRIMVDLAECKRRKGLS